MLFFADQLPSDFRDYRPCGAHWQSFIWPKDLTSVAGVGPRCGAINRIVIVIHGQRHIAQSGSSNTILGVQLGAAGKCRSDDTESANGLH